MFKHTVQVFGWVDYALKPLFLQTLLCGAGRWKAKMSTLPLFFFPHLLDRSVLSVEIDL